MFSFKNQKLRIDAVQKAISQAKRIYRTALNNLEQISEEVRIKKKMYHEIPMFKDSFKTKN